MEDKPLKAWNILHDVDVAINYMLQEISNRQPHQTPLHMEIMTFRYILAEIQKAKAELMEHIQPTNPRKEN